MKRTFGIQTMRLGVVSGLGVLLFWAATNASASGGEHAEYSPVVRDLTATNLYWGDTHLHTRNSA